MIDNYFKNIILKEDIQDRPDWKKGNQVFSVNRELAEELIKAGKAELLDDSVIELTTSSNNQDEEE